MMSFLVSLLPGGPLGSYSGSELSWELSSAACASSKNETSFLSMQLCDFSPLPAIHQNITSIFGVMEGMSRPNHPKHVVQRLPFMHGIENK